MALVVLLPRRLRLRLRLKLLLWLWLWRPGFRRTRLRLRLRLRRMELWRTRLWLLLRRSHFNNVRLRRRTRCVHVRLCRPLRGLGASAHLRRLVVRALLHCRRRIPIEAIGLLTTVLRLRLRRLRSGLRQLRARREGTAFVVRCAGGTFVLRWPSRHAGRALLCLRRLRLSGPLLGRGGAWQRTWAIDRTWRHQRLRSRHRLRTMLTVLRVRRARTGRAHQPDRMPRLVAGACRAIGRGACQA